MGRELPDLIDPTGVSTLKGNTIWNVFVNRKQLSISSARNRKIKREGIIARKTTWKMCQNEKNVLYLKDFPYKKVFLNIRPIYSLIILWCVMTTYAAKTVNLIRKNKILLNCIKEGGGAIYTMSLFWPPYWLLGLT